MFNNNYCSILEIVLHNHNVHTYVTAPAAYEESVRVCLDCKTELDSRVSQTTLTLTSSTVRT